MERELVEDQRIARIEYRGHRRTKGSGKGVVSVDAVSHQGQRPHFFMGGWDDIQRRQARTDRVEWKPDIDALRATNSSGIRVYMPRNRCAANLAPQKKTPAGRTGHAYPNRCRVRCEMVETRRP